MRTFISNSDEKLKIEEFLQLEWKKSSESLVNNRLIKRIFEMPSIAQNIEVSGGYYFAGINNDTMLFAFLSNIGKHPHPLIDLAYACAWYNSNLGGVYLIGVDNIKKEYFAPIKE